MQEQQAVTLETVFSEVLADLAFMICEADGVPEPEADAEWLETEIGYRGPVCGRLWLRCPRGFTLLLAENLLGMGGDDEAAFQAADDAVKQFMNIVCGQLGTALHGTEDIFNLSIPEIRVVEGEIAFDEPKDGETIWLGVEGYCVALRYAPVVTRSD